MGLTSDVVPPITGETVDELVLSIRTGLANVRRAPIEEITADTHIGPAVIDMVVGATIGMGVSITGNMSDFAHMTVREYADYLRSLPRVQL